MMIVLLILGVLLAMLALWQIPKWQVRSVEILEDQIELETEARKTVAQIIGGTAFLVGLYFTSQTLQVTQEGQITELFTQAVDQLGAVHRETDNPILEVRIGGIYALERIARDSDRDHPQIMEILTAYVRQNSPLKENDRPKDPNQNSLIIKPPRSDIETALRVIGRRNIEFDAHNRVIDLSFTNLQNAELSKYLLPKASLVRSNLWFANLHSTDLQGADLRLTNLESANLKDSDLRGAKFGLAILRDADLRNADLRQANLRGAILVRADMRGANLTGAQLGKSTTIQARDFSSIGFGTTDLTGADLRAVQGLTIEQVSQSSFDETTKLPERPGFRNLTEGKRTQKK